MDRKYLDKHLELAYSGLGGQSLEITRVDGHPLLIIRWSGENTKPLQAALSSCVAQSLLLPYNGECEGSGYILTQNAVLLEVFEALRKEGMPPQFHMCAFDDPSVEEAWDGIQARKQDMAEWLASDPIFSYNGTMLLESGPDGPEIPHIDPEKLPFLPRMYFYFNQWRLMRRIRKLQKDL